MTFNDTNEPSRPAPGGDATPRGKESGELERGEFELQCSELQPLHHLYVEGELDALRSGQLLHHLEGCGGCRRRNEELQNERRWLTESALKTPALSPRFRAKVVARIAEEAERRRGRRRFQRLLRIINTAAAALCVAAAAVLALTAILRGPPQRPDGRLAEPLTSAAVTAAWENDLYCPSDDSIEGNEGLDPLFPGTDLVCPTCADSVDPGLGGLAVLGRHGNFRTAIRFSRGMLGETRRDEDPCPPDPNLDGKSDGSDVAFFWQQLLSSADLPAIAASLAEAIEVECDEACEEV